MSIGNEVKFKEVKQYSRKPFDVDAVQVTEENLEEVAKWCGGDVRTETKRARAVRYIKVRVYKALDEDQTKAYVGNWVLYAGSGYKVYTNNAFHRTFEQRRTNARDAGTGQFVSHETAEANPATTVEEG